MLKRGKDSTVEEEEVEEEEEEDEEEVGIIRKNNEVEWRERVVEGERKIGEEEEDWEGGLEEVEEQRMEMEMTVKRKKKKKKWKSKRKRICHPGRREAIEAVENIGGKEKRVVYLDPGINPIFTTVVANPHAFESRRLPSDQLVRHEKISWSQARFHHDISWRATTTGPG